LNQFKDSAETTILPVPELNKGADSFGVESDEMLDPGTVYLSPIINFTKRVYSCFRVRIGLRTQGPKKHDIRPDK